MAELIAAASSLSQIGLSGLLILVLIGGYRGWWYYGTTYRSVEKERDTWRTIALSGTNIAERVVILSGKTP